MIQRKLSISEDIPLREFLERVVDERDKFYQSRFHAAEIAVSTALAAQEKAVAKAEDAQKEYNIRSNEFRGQLDDQAKLLMQRQEALGLFRVEGDKLETMRLFFDSKLEDQRLAFEKTIEALAKEIASLRETRSKTSGEKNSSKDFWGYLVAVAGIGLALVFHFIK